jgi:hypothetical protein
MLGVIVLWWELEVGAGGEVYFCARGGDSEFGGWSEVRTLD